MTRRFGQDPHIVGRTMTLDGAPGYTIYGVMPRDVTFPSQADLFRSSGIAADPGYYRRRDVRSMMVVARLAPTATINDARGAIEALARRLEAEFPGTNAGLTFRVTPLRDICTATIRPYVWLLFAAVSLVLVVACTNVANLLLSRAIGRAREIAVRTALGATRWQILRQQLIETLLLAGLGTGLGAGMAFVGVRVITRLVPVPLPPWMQLRIDGTTIMFLIAIGLLTGIVTGIAPALRSRDDDLHAILKEGARGASSGARQRRFRTILVVAEVALALVLLVGAGLLLRSVWQLHHVDPGFRTDHALTFRVELGWTAYGTLEKTSAFHRQVMERVHALPGVTRATFDSNLPMSGKPRAPVVVHLPGQSPDQDAQNPYVHLHIIGPTYFDTMGIGIEEGRAFDDRDGADGQPAVVVSRRLADRLWPGAEAVGRQVLMQNNTVKPVVYTVIGISSAVLHHELDGAPGLDVYRPFTQASTGGAYYVVRTAGDPRLLVNAAPSSIERIDPNQSFLDVQIYDTRVANRMWQRRVAGVLFGGFAVLAATLAAIGLYGVLSYLVGQQQREIAVRMALGATTRDVIGLVLGRALALTGLGTVVGLAIAIPLARATASMLFGIRPIDPVTFVGVPVLLAVISVCASSVPVRRALRLTPIVALKSE